MLKVCTSMSKKRNVSTRLTTKLACRYGVQRNSGKVQRLVGCKKLNLDANAF